MCVYVLQAIFFYHVLSVANVVEESLHMKAASEYIFPLHFILLYYIGEFNSADLHCLDRSCGNIYSTQWSPCLEINVGSF